MHVSMETKMRGVIAGKKRENLFREISYILRQWPELDRNVFFQAHYRGSSPEDISRALQLEVSAVNDILKQCDRRLHNCLRSYSIPDPLRKSA
jgi:DNA-directed RNA polymerase specialized sigma24 family protein